MKKLLFAGFIALLAVLVLGIAGFAYAQGQTPPSPETPYGPDRWGSSMPGMMNGWGRGMMGGFRTGEYGPMHEYMVNAFAEALGLTPEEVQSRLEAGETMWQVAQSTGLSDEEISDLMLTARTAAFNQAVSDGAITQEQADFMLERMNQMQGSGLCHGRGGPGGGRGPGWRWNNSQAEQ